MNTWDWDFEAHRGPDGWRWHTCNGRTLVAAGTTRTRIGARLRAHIFALTARWHRPRPHTTRDLIITLKSGTQLRIPATTYRIRTSPVTQALSHLNLNNPSTGQVALDYLDPRQVAAIHHEPTPPGGH